MFALLYMRVALELSKKSKEQKQTDRNGNPVLSFIKKELDLYRFNIGDTEFKLTQEEKDKVIEIIEIASS